MSTIYKTAQIEIDLDVDDIIDFIDSASHKDKKAIRLKLNVDLKEQAEGPEIFNSYWQDLFNRIVKKYHTPFVAESKIGI